MLTPLETLVNTIGVCIVKYGITPNLNIILFMCIFSSTIYFMS